MVLTPYDPIASIPRTSHHPILQYMGVKTKEGGPGALYMYHHKNDADVYLGGWEGGGRSPTETTLCTFTPCPEEQTARHPPTSQTFKPPVLGQTQHEKASLIHAALSPLLPHLPR